MPLEIIGGLDRGTVFIYAFPLAASNKSICSRLPCQNLSLAINFLEFPTRPLRAAIVFPLNTESLSSQQQAFIF